MKIVYRNSHNLVKGHTQHQIADVASLLLVGYTNYEQDMADLAAAVEEVSRVSMGFVLDVAYWLGMGVDANHDATVAEAKAWTWVDTMDWAYEIVED